MNAANSGRLEVELDELPPGASLHSVTAEAVELDGRACLRVALTEDVALRGIPGIDYIDMPTLVKLPMDFEVGVIEVDVRSRLLPDAPDYARAFAGIAFHVSDTLDSFESVYVRPMNGVQLAPAPPRDKRGIQYFAYPDWKFDRLREEFSDGRYEAAADIRPDRWLRLKVACMPSAITASIDGVDVLAVDPLVNGVAGRLALWVDIGTEAFFANLSVTSALP